MDQKLTRYLAELPEWDIALQSDSVSVHFQNIDVSPDGKTWVTGDHKLPGMQFPLAWYFETGTNEKVKSEEVDDKLFVPKTLAFPSPNIPEAKFVAFSSDKDKNHIVYGVLLSSGASTGGLIETDKNRIPLGTEEWHQIPGKSQK